MENTYCQLGLNGHFCDEKKTASKILTEKESARKFLPGGNTDKFNSKPF
jgi:hypothetical protein